jgi:hypothetical protein
VRYARTGLLLLLLVSSVAAGAVACGRGGASAADTEARLKKAMLAADDIGAGYTLALARVQSNEDAATSRPDTENARRQQADWGQVLAYDVEFSPPAETDLVFTSAVARLMNTATLFRTAEGAGASLAYTRTLPPSVVANFLVNDGSGTKISATQVAVDDEFPPAGDESFAWRLSGKAAFDGGLDVTFVADAVFVRVGRLTGSVIVVGLGQEPGRAGVTALVDRFVERARAAGS